MMVNPYYALATAVFIIVVLYFLFWPESPLVRRIKRMAASSKRAEIEDALKFLYECQRSGASCNQTILQQALNLNLTRARQLIEHLYALQLIEKEGTGFGLSGQGREYALRVIRLLL